MFNKKPAADLNRPSLEEEIASMRAKIATSPENVIPENDEGSWNDRNHQPNSLKYRLETKVTVVGRVRRHLILVLLLSLPVLALAGFLSLRYSQKARIAVLERTKTVAGLIKDTPLNKTLRPVLQNLHKKLRAYDQNQRVNQFVSSGSLALANLKCADVLKEGLDRKLKGALSTDDRYLMMSCTLFQDAPQSAVRYGSEAFRNDEAPRWEGLTELLLFTEAQRRVHILDVVSQQKDKYCPDWKATAACLVRFANEGALPYPLPSWESAYAVLNKDIAQQPSHIQAWLQYLAGQYALKAQKAAEPYLTKAKIALDRINDPMLEREIFRGRVRNAFQMNDKSLMEKVWEERPIERMAEDTTAFMDVDLLHSLMMVPAEGRSHLEIFLQQPQAAQRFRFNFSWMRFIVEQSILLGLPGAADEWLTNILAQGKTSDEGKTTDVYGLLRVRLLLASEKYLNALELMTKMERFAAKTAEWHQLKGLAVLGASSASRERLVQAAKEFQSATNAQPQSASPFALIVTFLSLELPLKAEATLAYWGQMKRDDEALYAFARGLVRYASGDPTAARQIWNDGLAKYPNRTFWANMNQNIEADPEYLRRDLFKRLSSMLSPDSPLGPLTLWRQKP